MILVAHWPTVTTTAPQQLSEYMTAMARWWQEEEIILSLVSEVNKKQRKYKVYQVKFSILPSPLAVFFIF